MSYFRVFRKKLNNLVIAIYVLMAFFAIPHLIDDFLFDIPAEFGLTNLQAQVLSGVFIVIYLVILVMVSRGWRSGFFGTLFMGSFLSLAVLLKHIPKIILPQPYWSGWFSEALIIGLMISGIILVIVSILALAQKSPDLCG
jgi:hypothetical protein